MKGVLIAKPVAGSCGLARVLHVLKMVKAGQRMQLLLLLIERQRQMLEAAVSTSESWQLRCSLRRPRCSPPLCRSLSNG